MAGDKKKVAYGLGVRKVQLPLVLVGVPDKVARGPIDAPSRQAYPGRKIKKEGAAV